MFFSSLSFFRVIKRQKVNNRDTKRRKIRALGERKRINLFILDNVLIMVNLQYFIQCEKHSLRIISIPIDSLEAFHYFINIL